MFDYIIIDCGSTMGKISSRILEESDQVLLMSVLNLPCLANTNKLLEGFEELGAPPPQAVNNR